MPSIPPFSSPLVFIQRWGIRDEATREHRTSEICMGEIERCAKAAAELGPSAVFFLLILGNRVSQCLLGTLCGSFFMLSVPIPQYN